MLSSCKGEQRYGLGSVLSVPCEECKFVNPVATDSRQPRSEGHSRGPAPFSSDAKIAMGMLHAGLGETHVNGVMSVLDIPSLS